MSVIRGSRKNCQAADVFCFTPYVRTVLFLWRVINIQAEIKQVICVCFFIVLYTSIPGEGGTCKKIGWGCAARFPKPLSLFDESMRFSLPHFRPDQKFDTIFLTIVADTVVLNIICEGLFLIVLSIIKKKWLLSKNVPNPRPECKYHTLFMTRMAKMDTLFMKKTA